MTKPFLFRVGTKAKVLSELNKFNPNHLHFIYSRPYMDPFPFIYSDATDDLQEASVIKDVLIDNDSISCKWPSFIEPVIFHLQFYPFLLLLMTLNAEISTVDWNTIQENDAHYWKSCRTFLNALLSDTIEKLQKLKEPVALAHWLQREFFMKRHDNNGRKAYQELMNQQGIGLYSIDPFQLRKFR